MPEGELTGPYHQCVSLELNKFNAEHYVNTETVSQVRSGCNSFKKSFEQQQRSFGSLPDDVFCTGKVNFDARCKINAGSRRVLMCTRCDSCSWFLAGIQKFSATCPGMDLDQEHVRGYHTIENAEHWIRESAPYSYGHRNTGCSASNCCDELSVKMKGFEKRFKFKNGIYSDQSGLTMRRNDNPIFQGWQISQYGSNTLMSSLSASNKVCPSDTHVWYDERAGQAQNIEIKCAKQANAVWSEWSQWVECSCRFRATYRERTCQSQKCSGHSVETKPCSRKLECSNCCGEIEVKLPNVDEFRKSSELSSVDTVFYLTEHQDKGKPIYEARNGQSYLRPYINMYWIVTKDVRSADFIYFNEDSSICPTYANQLKWNYKSGSSKDFHFEHDNRIQFVCKQTKVKKATGMSEVTTTKVPNTTAKTEVTKTDKGCCVSVKVDIPEDKNPGDYAGLYEFDSDGNHYRNRVSVRTMMKVHSYWALAQDKDTAAYKLYHMSNVDCPEMATHGQWKVLHNGNWVGDKNIRVTCAVSTVATTRVTTTTTRMATTQSTTVTTRTTPSDDSSCCQTIIIDRGDSRSVELQKSASHEHGWISLATKNTFTVQNQYAVFGFDYSISQVACYAKLKTSDKLCPSRIAAEWKCLDGSWNSAPNFRISCKPKPTTAPITTTRTVKSTVKTTASTTQQTTTATTKRQLSLGTTAKPTTTPKVVAKSSSKTVEGCCKRLILRNHAVSTLPSLYKLKVNENEDNKWFNKDHSYTVHWEVKSSQNYWIFGQDYDIGKVKCYASLKAEDIKTSNCPETVAAWTCFTSPQGWIVSPFDIECDQYTDMESLPQIQAPKRPEVDRPNTTPKVTSATTTQTTSTTTLKVVAQKRDNNGCCSVLQSVWPREDKNFDANIAGKYRKIFGFYRKDNDRRVELKMMETYFAILVNGNNKIYATIDQGGEKVKCPEEVKSWKLYDGNSWVVSTDFTLTCPTLIDNEVDDVDYTSSNDDYDLIELTTTAQTTTTEWTTTPWSTMAPTVPADTVEVWAPWSSCSSTCLGIQTRAAFNDNAPSQVRPCGRACPQLSSWFEWSSCSAWCGMGKQMRRRLCIKGQQLSNDCEEPKQDRFEEKTCYLKPCPMTDPKNCCQAISITTTAPSPLQGTYYMADSRGSVKYKHINHDYFVYKG